MRFARLKWIGAILLIGFALSSVLISSCIKPSTGNSEISFSPLDSIAVLPIIFDSINKAALDYEAIQVCIPDGCSVMAVRSRMRIQANSAGQIMIGHDISNNDILQAIIDFYDKEKIDLDTYSTARFMRFNDLILNTEIYNIEKYIKQLSKEKNSSLECFIAFKKEELKVWQRYKLYKTALMLDELLIPNIYSHVQIDAPDNSAIRYYLLQKAFEAFYIMRDKESKKHFGKSYAYLFKRAKLDDDFNSTKKIEIIHALIPVQLKRNEDKCVVPPPPR